jgi:hypothetical protein
MQPTFREILIFFKKKLFQIKMDINFACMNSKKN